MMIDSALPDWPPAPDEPNGEERARAYIAWIRQHDHPHLAEAQRMLRERYPGIVGIGRSSVRAELLAMWTLSERMSGLSIGTVWTKAPSGSYAMVDILITADGRLETRLGWNMRPA